MPNHKMKRQKKMGETPIILLPVVASEPHIKSRTPSDSAIVAIFQDKRKPAERVKPAFPLDSAAIFHADEAKQHISQANRRGLRGAIARRVLSWIPPRRLQRVLPRPLRYAS